jgi:hypothetical protein
MRLMRAGVSLVPCSQITSRPSRSSVMPFAMFDGCRTVSSACAANGNVSPESCRRMMAMFLGPGSGTVVK